MTKQTAIIKLIYTFLLLNVITHLVIGNDYTECGESPSKKYRELAKQIGKIII